MTEEPHHQPPLKRGERRRAAAEAPSRTRSTRAQATTNADDASPAPRRAAGRPRRGRAAAKKEEVDEDEDAASVAPPTPKSPAFEDDKYVDAEAPSTFLQLVLSFFYADIFADHRRHQPERSKKRKLMIRLCARGAASHAVGNPRLRRDRLLHGV